MSCIPGGAAIQHASLHARLGALTLTLSRTRDLRLFVTTAKMSLVETFTDKAGVTWGKYQDDSDANSFFYVNSRYVFEAIEGPRLQRCCILPPCTLLHCALPLISLSDNAVRMRHSGTSQSALPLLHLLLQLAVQKRHKSVAGRR